MEELQVRGLDGLSRRGFLQAGAAATGLLAGGFLLSACGESSSGAKVAKDLTIGTSIVDSVIQPLDKQYGTYQFNAFDSLVRVLQDGPNAEPRLSTSWKRMPGDKVWQFTLRGGATFHDGSPVTADDVAFTFNEIIAKQYGLIVMLTGITKVTATDAKTVQIETANPDPLLLSKVGQVFIVPKAYWQKVGVEGFGKAPIGSGPYKIASFSPDGGLQFEAYDGFWGDKPKTKKIKQTYFTDSGALSAALEAGEIDAAHNLDASATQTLKSSGVKLFNSKGNGNNMLQLNTTKAPFDTLEARQAAILALNAPSLVSALTYGTGVLEDGQVPLPGVTGYTSTIKRPGQDIEKAKSLLEQSGHKGASVTISGMKLSQSTLEAVAGQLKAVGFSPKIVANEIPVWVQEFRNGTDAEVFYRGASYTGVFDADRVFSFVSFSPKPMVKDSKWDGLLSAEREELDSAARKTKLIACSQYLLDQSYILYTYGSSTVGGTRKGVSGIDFSTGLMILLDKAVKS